MSDIYLGNNTYRDSNTGQCFVYYEDLGEIPVQCPPSSGSTLPPIISGGISTTGSSGGYIQQGQSWYNDMLNALLGLAAIGQGGTIQGGAINPRQPSVQQILQSPTQPLSQAPISNAGASFGAGIQDFITQNFTLLALGAGLLILYKSGRK
jgi:hypothetical protein